MCVLYMRGVCDIILYKVDKKLALSLSVVCTCVCPGTDATHAEHIETIKNRNYVGVQSDGHFVPGELGMGLVEGQAEVSPFNIVWEFW